MAAGEANHRQKHPRDRDVYHEEPPA